MSHDIEPMRSPRENAKIEALRKKRREKFKKNILKYRITLADIEETVLRHSGAISPDRFSAVSKLVSGHPVCQRGDLKGPSKKIPFWRTLARALLRPIGEKENRPLHLSDTQQQSRAAWLADAELTSLYYLPHCSSRSEWPRSKSNKHIAVAIPILLLPDCNAGTCPFLTLSSLCHNERNDTASHRRNPGTRQTRPLSSKKKTNAHNSSKHSGPRSHPSDSAKVGKPKRRSK